MELLVKRGSSPPEGHFMMNISGAQFTSNWDAAIGKTYLGTHSYKYNIKKVFMFYFLLYNIK